MSARSARNSKASPPPSITRLANKASARKSRPSGSCRTSATDQGRHMAVSEAQQSQSPPLSPAEADLLGHPRGLVFLFSTEMWERFSYYGMRALLTLYMVKYLLLPGHHEGVIGLATLRSALESISGPLGVQPFSSHLYGIYTGLVYFTPLIGGIIADRVLGQHYTILIGAALMAVGHFMMAFEPLFLLALFM